MPAGCGFIAGIVRHKRQDLYSGCDGMHVHTD